MSDNKFWLRFWKIAGTCLCISIISMSSCAIHRDYKISNLIESGEDPVAVKCALNSGQYDRVPCALIGLEKAKKMEN